MGYYQVTKSIALCSEAGEFNAAWRANDHDSGTDVRKSTIHRGTGADLLRAAITAGDGELSRHVGDASELQVCRTVGAAGAARHHAGCGATAAVQEIRAGRSVIRHRTGRSNSSAFH